MCIFWYQKSVNPSQSGERVNLDRLSYLGCAYALSGQRYKALETINLIEESRGPFLDGEVDYGVGTIYANLGEFNKSVDHLKEASKTIGFGRTTYDWDSRLVSLFGNEEFEELVRPKN